MIIINRYYVVTQVIYRVNLTVDQESRLEFFTSFPKDPIHKGSLQLRTGALIGLPSTFYYRSVNDVESNSILVGQEIIDWSSSAGEELQNALVLSDKAKAFAIAREIFYVKSFGVHINTVMQTCSLLLAYTSGSVLNDRFLLTLRLKPWARFSVFSLIAVAWLSVYIVVNDTVQCWYDNSVDESAAKLRKIYAEGGFEYYNAVLRRNHALRTLLGSRGKRQFTNYGNVVSVWRNPSVQLTSRRDNLLKYLKEYEDEAETIAAADDDVKQTDTEAA